MGVSVQQVIGFAPEIEDTTQSDHVIVSCCKARGRSTVSQQVCSAHAMDSSERWAKRFVSERGTAANCTKKRKDPACCPAAALVLRSWQMKTVVTIITLILLAFSPATAESAKTTAVPTTREVYFSPDGGCTAAIVIELSHAMSNVLVQAYSFTSKEIAKALTDAHKRGVKVQVILDKSNLTEKYSSADFIAHAGIPVLIDSEHAIAHNKIMVIDGTTVITGSFNFTKAAEEHNAENLLVIHETALARKYAENWQQHAAHSQAYAGR